MTIRARLREAQPRSDLAKRLGISNAYAHEIADQQPVGSTKTLARIARELGLTAQEIGESVLEFYPAPSSPSPPAPTPSSLEPE